MDNIEAILTEHEGALNLKFTPEQTANFQTYMELLVEWNEKINLTAITEPKEVAVKHFLDSLTVLNAVNIKSGSRVIDVGTGAGFPGIPLKIMRPDMELTLLDSLNKRLIFLKEVCTALKIDASLVHARAEEGGRQKQLREKFDIATARAVAPLNLLCEYCLPFLKVGGLFVAMKGPNCTDEVKNAKKAISLLGCELTEQKELVLPDNSGRTLILIKKIKTTPDIYPRHGSKISKYPL
jgi:16S rRNA (guanine527-N7)-methyltransferase